MHSHRPTLKQKNKPFKGGKGAVKGLGGRLVTKPSGTSVASSSSPNVISKNTRLLVAKQKRQKKNEEALVRRRIGSGRSSAVPPKVVMILPFKRGLSALEFKRAILDLVLESGVPVHDLALGRLPCHTATFQLPAWAISTASGEERKQRVTLIDVDPYTVLNDGAWPSDAAYNAVLDVAKTANVLVCLLPSRASLEDPPFDTAGYEFLSAIKMQGLPTPVGVMIGDADYAAMDPNKKREKRHLISRFFESEFGPDKKFFCATSPSELKTVLRGVANCAPKEFTWRRSRGYLLADRVVLRDATPTNRPSLLLEGYARGVGLTVRHPVHITGIGDFILETIEMLQDPCKSTAKKKNTLGTAEQDVVLVETLTPEIERELETSWQALQPYDPLSADQTWPTTEELQAAKKQRGTHHISAPQEQDHQSAWLEALGSDDEREDENEEPDDEHMTCSEEPQRSDAAFNDEDPQTAEDDMQDEALPKESFGDMTTEKKRLAFELTERSREDLEYPDEVDTPTDQLAKTRFARYRGLRSFRSSPWDPLEELPIEYSRIYEYDAFGPTMACAKKTYAEDSAHVCEVGSVTGAYVRLQLRLATDVPSEAVKVEALRRYLTELHAFQQQEEGLVPRYPLILSSLLPYERKVTVMHMRVVPRDDVEESLPSKTPVEFHCGFRKFPARPIFSHGRTAITTRTTTDKSRYERFLHPHVTTVASIYAPTMAPPAPVLMFYRGEDASRTRLWGWGGLLESDPRRVIVKRIVLTGYPFRARKKKAVVRYMFFYPEDVRWFMPIELCSKKGLRGHIKEPLGTHGYMKCIFNNVVDQSDTICMFLYKRVYPKWFPLTWGDIEDAATDA